MSYFISELSAASATTSNWIARRNPQKPGNSGHFRASLADISPISSCSFALFVDICTFLVFLESFFGMASVCIEFFVQLRVLRAFVVLLLGCGNRCAGRLRVSPLLMPPQIQKIPRLLHPRTKHRRQTFPFW